MHRIKMVSLKCSFIGPWRIEPKLKTRSRTASSTRLSSRLFALLAPSPDPIYRSLTVAWRAGQTVRIRFPPAESLVRTRQHPSVPAQLGADASGCGRKNRTFASFGEYDPLCSIDDGVFETRSRPIGSGCSGQTSKSRYVTPGPAATRWFPIVAHWIHAIIAPSITSVARRCERVVVRHLHQLVQLPSPNAHVPAIEQR
jgi:hypothetical protein